MQTTAPNVVTLIGVTLDSNGVSGGNIAIGGGTLSTPGTLDLASVTSINNPTGAVGIVGTWGTVVGTITASGERRSIRIDLGGRFKPWRRC